MKTQTISDIRSTCQLLDLVRARIRTHADDFAKDESLNALSTAERMITDAAMLLERAPTIEDAAAVMRMSIRLIESRKVEREEKENV